MTFKQLATCNTERPPQYNRNNNT